MADLIDLSIYKDNTYKPNLRVLRQQRKTGVLEEFPGALDLIYSISATKAGPAIDPALEAPAIPWIDAPSIYYAEFAGAIHSPILFPAYEGKYVYLRLYNPSKSINIVIKVAVLLHRML